MTNQRNHLSQSVADSNTADSNTETFTYIYTCIYIRFYEW